MSNPIVKPHILSSDGGPIYTETNLDQFIVEPFNTVSAFLFLFLAGYWYLRLRGQFGKYKLLTLSTALLTIGAVGGTVYHAFRADAFFMFMDWVPIVLLCWAASVYFVYRISKSIAFAAFIMVLSVVSQFLIFEFVPDEKSTNWSYATMGFLVIVPTVWNLIKTKFFEWWWVIYSFTAFCIALLFRILDPLEIIPIGTHFLWHAFGVLAGHFMFKYIFELQSNDFKMVPDKIRV